MLRRLIPQGNNGSLTVYLPKKWIENRGLKRGNQVLIEETDTNLIISSEQKHKEKTYSFKLTTEKEPSIRIILNHLYRLGYDSITISLSKPIQGKLIRSIVEYNLLGFEIVNETIDKISIQNVTEPNTEKQEVLLRRIFFLVQDSLESISLGKLDSITRNTEVLTRYGNFCRRLIVQKRFSEEMTYQYWVIIHHLSNIQRILLHFSKEKFSTDSGKDIKEVSDLFRHVHSSFYDKNFISLQKSNEDLRNLLYSKHIANIKKSKEPLLVFYLAELTRFIYLLTSPLLAVVLYDSLSSDSV